jgi:type IV pilus biogenesis protein CpaD/CtpE
MKAVSPVLHVLALALASGCAPTVNDPADVRANTALVNEQFHRAWFDQFDVEFTAPVVDVRVSGDLGVAQGT